MSCQVAVWQGAHSLLCGRQATGQHFLSVSASHPFAVRKCWEARPLKTVNRQLGFAKSAGQDRRFSQLARADAGALVNRSSERIAIDSVRGRSSLSTHQRGLNVESGHADFPGGGTMKGRKACFQTKEAAEKVVSRKLKDLLQ